jgi:serine/threonine protein kinase/predicted negative regulator of RcsB-dependent stress response
MGRFDHDTVMQILSDVLALPQDQRAALLDRSCDGNAALRAEVEELLCCEQRAARLFGEEAVDISLVAAPAEIGPYRLLELIGEGGMGSVYKADQQYPIRRTVAIKIIKLGMDTREVIARFEAERQALAALDHPNVARVIDAGATETGRPYFVMEYVPGEPITAAADRRNLTISQRLALFTQVCHAVQHAHQKAIIHRDLKPSNILVSETDGKLQVKVIDFGVAKAISTPLTDHSFLTEMGELVGTPEYMSPEQADRSQGIEGIHDIDTRSDVYSLGVTLYELLAGAPPVDGRSLRSRGYAEIQRVIRQVDPPRPSSRFSSMGSSADEVARRRQSSVENLRRQLRGELEWIPLKAMRKERDRRYATAGELAEDIENYLADRPLRAGPESTRYLVRKFLSRNRRGVGVAAAMTALLLAGIVGTAWQAVRATRAQRQLRTALAEVQQQKKQADDANQSLSAVNEFFTAGVIGASDPEVTRGKPLSVLEALDKAAATIASSLPQNVKTKSAIEVAISKSYRALGQPDRALPHSRAAVDLCAQQFAPDDPPTIVARADVAWNLMELGKLSEAEPVVQELVDCTTKRYGASDLQTLSAIAQLGTLRYRQGRLSDAEPLCAAALSGIRKARGDSSVDTLRAINILALVYRGQGKLDQAEPLLRETVASSKSILGDDHPDTLVAMSTFGAVLQAQGKLDEAEAVKRDALEKSRRVFGEDHVNTITFIQNYADLLALRGKKEQAGELFREALEKSRRVAGPDHHATLAVTNNYARLLDSQGRFDEAEPLFRQAVELGRKARGIGHPDVLISILNYAQALASHGRLDDAERLDREALQVARETLGDDHRLTMVFMQNLGQVLIQQKKDADGEALLRESLRRRRSVLGNDHPETLGVLEALGQFLIDRDRLADAEPLAGELYRLSSSPRANNPPRLAATNMMQWGVCLAALGRYEQADPVLLETQRRLTAAGMGKSPTLHDLLSIRALVLRKLGREEDASKIEEQLQAIAVPTQPTSRSTH